MAHFLKVQFISRDLPFEGSGGTSVYRLSLLRYLHSLGCEIEYLLLHYKGEDESAIKNNVYNFGRFFKVIRMPLMNNRQYPIWSALPKNNEISFLEMNVKRWKPDLIIADHPWLGGLFNGKIKNENSVTSVLTHDVQYKKIIEFKKYGVNPYKRNKGYKQPHWDKKMERDLLSKVDIILAIQKEDFSIYQRMLPLKEIEYLPMAAEPPMANRSEEITGRCLFVGGSAHHNAFGLTWFLSEVWPLVTSQNPLATLHVCGEIYKEMNAASYENETSIVFKGRVENLHQEYNEAQVCVIPLIVGSGLKIKLVEAMSYGKACVSTTVGIQGIENVVNFGVITARGKVKFADAINTLLKDKSMRKFYGLMNKQYTKTYLTPDVSYGPFILKVLNKIKRKQFINK